MGNSESDQRDEQPAGERPSVQWLRAVWSFTEGDYTVQIDKLPLGRPRFSISIGVLREGSLTSRIPARYNYVSGQVRFETLPSPELIGRLLGRASEWIEAEVQESEARWQERQQRRQNR